MAERDISDWEVRNAVSVSCQQGRVQMQWDGTYKYLATYVGVVMDWRANVVTVWYNTGSGGGGWSTPDALE